MTTETLPTPGQYLLLKLARAMSREKAKEANNRARPWFQTVVRLVFHLAGFACLTYAAFIGHPIAGFVMMGISFFAMSFLMTSTRVETNTTPPNHSWATGDRRG